MIYAYVVVPDEDGDWGLIVVGSNQDGDVSARRIYTGVSLDEVVSHCLGCTPIVVADDWEGALER